jgi:bifunctional non-homologous end joining protein LigD
VPVLIGKSKAWVDYCDSERSLEDAIKRLGKARIAA